MNDLLFIEIKTQSLTKKAEKTRAIFNEYTH